MSTVYEAPCNGLMTDDERIGLLWLREGNGHKYIGLDPRKFVRPEAEALLRALPGLRELGLVVVDPPSSGARRYWLTTEGRRTAEITTLPNSSALCATCGHPRSDHQLQLPAPCRHGAGPAPTPEPGECYLRAVDAWCKTGCQCLVFSPERAGHLAGAEQKGGGE